MITKMNKTEISVKILKLKKIKVFIIRITPKTNQHMCRVGSIQKAVQALASDIGFWRPSSILLKKLRNANKKIMRQIPQGKYAYCKYLEIIQAGVE